MVPRVSCQDAIRLRSAAGMSVRVASGMAARRLVARSCAIWRYALRGATDDVIGPVVSVTMTLSGLRAGDSTLSPRARVGNGARVARPSWQPVQSLVGFSVASLLSSVARVVGCARSMSRLHLRDCTCGEALGRVRGCGPLRGQCGTGLRRADTRRVLWCRGRVSILWRVVGRGGGRTCAVFGLGCHAVWRLGQLR
jgi:hypothetical protein